MTGKVTQTWYREDTWPPGQMVRADSRPPMDAWPHPSQAPYQVLLDGPQGQLIFAPQDQESYIQAA